MSELCIEPKLDIRIGKGESKNLIFRITTDAFSETDKLLFAMKLFSDSKQFIHTKENIVSELEIEDGKYIFLVPITTEFSRSLIQDTNYYYDITLINQAGEEKPLMFPAKFTICSTIGASLDKVGG